MQAHRDCRGIDGIRWCAALKHRGVTPRFGALQAWYHAGRIRFAETGYVPGEDVYAAFGQSLGGRYIVVFFVYKPSTATAIVISAREMTDKERTTYGRK